MKHMRSSSCAPAAYAQLVKVPRSVWHQGVLPYLMLDDLTSLLHLALASRSLYDHVFARLLVLFGDVCCKTHKLYRTDVDDELAPSTWSVAFLHLLCKYLADHRKNWALVFPALRGALHANQVDAFGLVLSLMRHPDRDEAHAHHHGTALLLAADRDFADSRLGAAATWTERVLEHVRQTAVDDNDEALDAVLCHAREYWCASEFKSHGLALWNHLLLSRDVEAGGPERFRKHGLPALTSIVTCAFPDQAIVIALYEEVLSSDKLDTADYKTCADSFYEAFDFMDGGMDDMQYAADFDGNKPSTLWADIVGRPTRGGFYPPFSALSQLGAWKVQRPDGSSKVPPQKDCLRLLRIMSIASSMRFGV